MIFGILSFGLVRWRIQKTEDDFREQLEEKDEQLTSSIVESRNSVQDDIETEINQVYDTIEDRYNEADDELESVKVGQTNLNKAFNDQVVEIYSDLYYLVLHEGTESYKIGAEIEVLEKAVDYDIIDAKKVNRNHISSMIEKFNDDDIYIAMGSSRSDKMIRILKKLRIQVTNDYKQKYDKLINLIEDSSDNLPF